MRKGGEREREKERERGGKEKRGEGTYSQFDLLKILRHLHINLPLYNLLN